MCNLIDDPASGMAQLQLMTGSSNFGTVDSFNTASGNTQLQHKNHDWELKQTAGFNTASGMAQLQHFLNFYIKSIMRRS